MWTIIGVVLAFSVMVVMLNRRYDLGFSMVVGTLVVGVFAGFGVGDFVEVVVKTVKNRTTIDLALIITLLWVLGTALKESGHLDRMIESLSRLLRDPRKILMLIPSLVGLLTVPGGAIMSAPLINDLGSEMELSDEAKTGVNLMFRHLWYPVYPLYPGLIMAARLGNVEIYDLVKLGVPVMVVTALLSFWYCFREYRPGSFVARVQGPRLPHLWHLMVSLAPVLMSMVLVVTLDFYFPTAILLGIALGLLSYLDWTGGLGAVWHQLKGRVKTVAAQGFTWRPAMTIFGIMLFREAVGASEAVVNTANALMAVGIPLGVLLVVVPLVTAVVTGMNMAAMGIAIPIFEPLLASDILRTNAVFLIFLSSTAGYLVSPLHVCLVLTKQYFKAQFSGVYRFVLYPAGGMLVASVLVAWWAGL